MRLSVVVPFRNELRALPTVIQRLLAVDFAALGVETELIFVDDGSTDAGRYLIDPPPRDDIQLIVHERNQGKGAAVRTGLEAATSDMLCIQDADLEYDPADIAALLPPLIDGSADAVFGSRNRGRYQPYSVWYKLGNQVLGVAAGLLFGRFVSDLYTGHKFMTRAAYSGLRLTANGFDIEAEWAAQLFKTRARIVEVPVSYTARSRDAGKKLKPRDGLTGLVRLVRVRVGR